MNTYSLPYGNQTLSVQVADENFCYYASPASGSAPNQAALLQDSLDHPIGAPRLEESVRPAMKVAVMVDDITRPTPKRVILSEVLRRLRNIGVPKSQLRVVLGLGTHRQMRPDEIETFVGKENLEGVELVNIDYKDKSCFVDLGVTENGMPIEVYRAVMEVDFKIAIGNIVPHVAAGWGGGAKMIQPAVCSERTTAVTHLMAATQQNVLEVCGNADNRVRREMEKIAGRVGLNFIVNTVLNDQKQMLGVFSGDFIRAHRAGVELARQVLCPRIPAEADIVIASANPAHVDMWQGCKPFIFSLFGLKPGGVLIFVIEGGEGLCGNAPQHEAVLRKYSLYPFDELKALVDQGKIEDRVGAHVPLFFATVRAKAQAILCVSRGLTLQDKQCLGFEHAETVEAALRRAYQLTSSQARVGILPYAGETLVRL